MSEKTVELHKRHSMETFDIKSNADLVLFGLKHGLIAVNSEPSAMSHKRAEDIVKVS
jgi:hypothetical protein